MKKINIIPKNIELTDKIRDYIEKKMSYFEKFINFEDDGVKCDFRIGRESAAHKNGNVYFAEVTIKTPKKDYGVKSENQESEEAAIDKLKDELKRKITDNKDKKVDLKRRAAIKNKEDIRNI